MSTLKADTIQSTGGGAATLTKQSAAKAWINFNGTGTIATRDSFNLSSLSDIGTGEYSVTITSAMSDTNYAVMVLLVVTQRMAQCLLITLVQTQTQLQHKG